MQCYAMHPIIPAKKVPRSTTTEAVLFSWGSLLQAYEKQNSDLIRRAARRGK